jgi:hypothetical protein
MAYFASRCKIVNDAITVYSEYTSEIIPEDFLNGFTVPLVEECWKLLNIECTMRDNEMNSIFRSWLDDTKHLNKVFLDILLQRSTAAAAAHADTFVSYYVHDTYYIARKCALLNNTLDLNSDGSRIEIRELFDGFHVPEIKKFWSKMANSSGFSGFWNFEHGEYHPKFPKGDSELESKDETALIAQLSELLKRKVEDDEGSGSKKSRAGLNSPWPAIYALTKIMAKLQENSIRH